MPGARTTTVLCCLALLAGLVAVGTSGAKEPKAPASAGPDPRLPRLRRVELGHRQAGEQGQGVREGLAEVAQEAAPEEARDRARHRRHVAVALPVRRGARLRGRLAVRGPVGPPRDPAGAFLLSLGARPEGRGLLHHGSPGAPARPVGHQPEGRGLHRQARPDAQAHEQPRRLGRARTSRAPASGSRGGATGSWPTWATSAATSRAATRSRATSCRTRCTSRPSGRPGPRSPARRRARSARGAPIAPPRRRTRAGCAWSPGTAA